MYMFCQVQQKLLKTWFAEHVHSPFVQKHSISPLIAESGLTRDQIAQWIGMQRVRAWGHYPCPECGGGMHKTALLQGYRPDYRLARARARMDPPRRRGPYKKRIRHHLPIVTLPPETPTHTPGPAAPLDEATGAEAEASVPRMHLWLDSPTGDDAKCIPLVWPVPAAASEPVSPPSGPVPVVSPHPPTAACLSCDLYKTWPLLPWAVDTVLPQTPPMVSLSVN